ncbi:MAG: hypothetical protein ABEI53_00390, partial [Candidatus Magasanikbacteria bacterium]
LTEDCLILKDKNRYCEKGNKKITVISEGKVVENWMNYVLDHGDKVLLDYSSSTLSKVKFRYNNIPDIPWKYLKSVEEIKEQK